METGQPRPLRARLGEFVRRARQRGLALTPQRLAIVEALISREDHPRADQICAMVRKRHPYVSLATVHRTLETLCESGEARKVTPLYDSARYDANLKPHHHVVCVRCRKVRDVEIPALSSALIEQGSLGDFKVLGLNLEIRALCARCQKLKAAARDRQAAAV